MNDPRSLSRRNKPARPFTPLLLGIAFSICAALAACGGGGSSGGSSSTSPPPPTGSTSSTSPLSSYNLTGSVSPVHDPAIFRQGSTWYAYSTDASPTQGGYIPVRCSKDKVAYTNCGFVFSTLPSWVATTVPGAQEIWAPEVSYFGGLYHMYYAVSSFGSNVSAIGVATNTTLDPTDPAYKWVDQGAVVTSSSSNNYNAIDPNILVDSDGKVWLTFGSFWEGIFQQQIDPTTGKLMSGSAMKHIARRASNVTYDPIEGASLVHVGSYYYLFVSWDFCCSSNPASSNYKIVVGRGTSPNGPFYDQNGSDMLTGGGTILLQGNSQWSGPGGATAYIDAGDASHQAENLITFHALNLSQNGLDYLFVKSLDFSSGWPEIKP